MSSSERFVPADGLWEVLPAMSSRREGAASVVHNGILYVCGGFSGETYLSSVDRFEPALRGSTDYPGTWRTGPPMREQRRRPSMAVTNGKIYACGGNDGPTVLA